jgi:hypothetical protein
VDPLSNPKKPETIFRSVVDPIEMEQILLRRNKKHFSQARDTPLAAPIVMDTLGWGSQTAQAEALLAGKFDPSVLTPNPLAQRILSLCKRSVPEIPPEIPIDKFKSFYSTWRVTTSTSPSGRHLSRQHLLFQPHSIVDDTDSESEAYYTTKESMCRILYVTVHYALRFGYCFLRWQQVVNSMLEKDPGDPKLHRLRVIHLYESDYNLILGTKFREVVQTCLDYGLIHSGCFGGLANRQLLDPVFLEIMQYDYASLTRYDTIKFANDAGSCCDRIIPAPSNAVARSMGLHKNVSLVHGRMLQEAKYQIKTQMGVSTTGTSVAVKTPYSERVKGVVHHL